MLAGCSTPYQEMGFTGGVKSQQATADTYRIISRGNSYTSGTTIQDYTLLKAAETTRAAELKKEKLPFQVVIDTLSFFEGAFVSALSPS